MIVKIKILMRKKYKYDFYFAGLDKDYIYKSLQPFSAKALEMTINEDSTDPLGSFKLRKEIAKMLFDYKGIDSSANNILITSGYRENLNIIFSILNEEYYAAEDPCYFKNSSIFKNAGKKLLRIPIDKYGFSVKDLEKGPAKVAITTPSHQFAEGILMGIRRRQRLINWANENYAYIFEDDYDSDFRYGPKLVPALKALDKEDRVIFSGSFSQSVGKIFSISYLCLPDELIEKLDLKSVEKSRISALEENLLYLFLASGEYRKYINRMTKIYKKKRDLFIKYISERRKDAIVEGDELGLFFTLRFSKKIPSDELVQKRLEERGIYLKSVDDYRHYKKNDRKYIVGFGGFEIEKIPRAANSLLEVFSEEENEKE